MSLSAKAEPSQFSSGEHSHVLKNSPSSLLFFSKSVIMAEMGILETTAPLPSPAFTNNPRNTRSTTKPGKIVRRITPNPQGAWISPVACPLPMREDLFCHCHGCQVMHGAPFQWAAIFHKEDLSFTKGASGLSFYSSAHKSQEYEMPTKVSCSFCRSPLMDEGRNVCLLFPASIDFNGSEDENRQKREAFKPTCQRAMDIADGLPKWSGMDGASELLDDYGHRVQQGKQAT
ncbi:hypothetical protein NUU61_001686 [Penicillium alfredii]|uniref:CENP-V/GFA domain-containing protein n=1 Tax=Penicillium alfredii TaxID=1506179 RepID=A0A9W9KFA1_9EURO|nr:uncharacterized protein NUU61_001686 [Penicillium alfredii]KAJ5104339.1 hypothetical protein NUU61_001686 [Penicillium alfredii]